MQRDESDWDVKNQMRAGGPCSIAEPVEVNAEGEGLPLGSISLTPPSIDVSPEIMKDADITTLASQGAPSPSKVPESLQSGLRTEAQVDVSPKTVKAANITTEILHFIQWTEAQIDVSPEMVKDADITTSASQGAPSPSKVPESLPTSFGDQGVTSIIAMHADSAGATSGVKSGSMPSQCGRRRTRRACEQCRESHIKCDGKRPCWRCAERGITCEYTRKQKRCSRTNHSRTTKGSSADTMGDQARVTVTDTVSELRHHQAVKSNRD